MRWVLAVILFLGVFGAALLWWGPGAEAVEVSEEERQLARESGAGAAQLVLAEPAPGLPTTLSQARAVLGDEALTAAAEGLAAYVAAHPGDGAGHALLSELLRRSKRLEEALEHGRMGAELLPTSSLTHWTYARSLITLAAQEGRAGGLAMLAAAKRMGPYKQELRTAIELDPSLIEARKEEALFLIFAPMVGDLPLGTERARELEDQDPLEGGLTVARALSRDKEGDGGGGLEAALAKVREVQAAFPDSQDPPWVLASLLLEAERYEEADAALQQVLDGPKGETYYQALHLRARICNERGADHDKALAYLSEYEQADPQWEWVPARAQVLCERGRALAGLGQSEEAREVLEQALELDPESKRTKAALEAL